MRILIFGNYLGGKVFFDELSEWLTKIGYTVDLLDWGNFRLYSNDFRFCNSLNYNVILKALIKTPFLRSHVKTFLVKKTIRSVKESYDIINIHFGNANNNKFLKLLKERGRKLVVSIWGSDYHRVSDKQRQKARKLYDAVDIINFGNIEMRDDFLDYYNDYHEKVAFAGLGNNKFYTIEKIMDEESLADSRNSLKIPNECFVITCGYKAYHVLQHFKMIEAIEKIRNQLPSNYLLVFPLTYQKDNQYIEDMKHKLDSSNLRYMVFEEFLTPDSLSRLRIVSNVYITIPISDAASSSMLEYLLSGNVVIAGKWLPYKFWEDLGLFFLKVEENELSGCILDVCSNYKAYQQKISQNRILIMENLSWKIKIQDWKTMFDS